MTSPDATRASSTVPVRVSLGMPPSTVPTAMVAPHNVRSGALWVLFSVTCFAIGDTIVRTVGPVFGVVLLLLARYALQTLSMGAWMVWRRARGVRVTHTTTFGLMLLRGVALFASAVLAVLALQHMPVAEYTAVVMLTPVLVTLLAWALLRHPLRPLELALVAGGFIGALIVVRPGSGLFGWVALLPLGVALCNAAYQLITNHHAQREDAVTTNFHTGWIGLVMALVWLAVEPPPATATMARSVDMALLLAMGVLATVAQLALIFALGRARAGALMPFLYLQIGVGALAGWLLLGDVPDLWSWVGMAVIGACGAASAWLHSRPAPS